MKTSDAINELAAAMVKAQAAMKPAVKDSQNPEFRSKYADLHSVTEAITGPMTDHGLTWWQDAITTEVGVAVTTRIVHTSGQWVEHGPMIVHLGKFDGHAVGSATTYARRYGLSAALGVVADDDDGNAAVAAAPQTETQAERVARVKREQAAKRAVNTGEPTVTVAEKDIPF